MIMLSMSMSMVIVSCSNKQVNKQKHFAWEQTEKVKQKRLQFNQIQVKVIPDM